MIDFPNSPSVGQTFTSGNSTWTWDGTKWVAAGAAGGSSIYLPLTGGTVTGNLAVQGTTTLTGAATLGPVSETSLIIPGGAMKPSGRLTLTSGQPVQVANVTAAPNIYYTPYVGNMIPLWNGTQFVWMPFQELTNVLANSSVGNAGPAAVVSNNVYDLYVWNNAGTLRLTRSPPWTAGGGNISSARGTGAGSAAQTTVNGIIVNAVAITNGPAAGYGHFIGTFLSGAGTGIDWGLGGTASGGVFGDLSLWNMYNRRFVQATNNDNGAAYAATTSWRLARGSGNNVNVYVVGQAEDAVTTTYYTQYQFAAAVGAYALAGIGIDSGSSPATARYVQSQSASAATINVVCEYGRSDLLGYHYMAGLELSDGSANNFCQGGQNALITKLMM